ncbi:MAG TPA: VacJ family lipoprotein [Steroidobacteraceae bacterium]|nr:VacJ family lipoprotein [Steroidobacteraceae bacterium]
MPKESAAPTALVLIIVAAVVSGCATQPVAHKDPRDPWERSNRAVWNFDMRLYHKVAQPVGSTYTRVTPHFLQVGIGNFFDNAQYPVVFVNDFLQAKFKTGLTDTGRFIMNSTIGLGGLFDPAAAAGIPKNDNDFGRTLGTWGVPPGPYLVLPFVGPSDIRDTAGKVPDGYLSLQNYLGYTWENLGVQTVYFLDLDARTVIPVYRLLESQHPFDQYAFARNAYLQQRQYLIRGQSVKTEEQQEEELERSLQDSDPGAGSPPRQ